MTFYAPVLWLYSVMVSVVFGASVYEALVVHPVWSRKPPESSGFLLAEAGTLRRNACRSRRAVGLG